MKYISIDLETTGLKPESHQILTFSGILEDKTSPDLSTCKRRAGLDDFVSHDSIDDAWDVVELFRKHYKK